MLHLLYLTDKETEVQMSSLMAPLSRSTTGTRSQALPQAQHSQPSTQQTVVLPVSSAPPYQNKFTKWERHMAISTLFYKQDI